jgi:hypothetical protein
MPFLATSCRVFPQFSPSLPFEGNKEKERNKREGNKERKKQKVKERVQKEGKTSKPKGAKNFFSSSDRSIEKEKKG